MKKYLFVFVTCLFCICLISCNNGKNDEKKTSTDSLPNNNQATAPAPDPCEGIGTIDLCENVSGIANFIIKSGDALTMMGRFDGLYKTDNQGRDIKAMDNVYWIDKCTILAISDFLTTQLTPQGTPKYDGIRVYIGCEVKDNPQYAGFPYRRKTTLFIFATTPRSNPAMDKSSHADDRVNLIPPKAGCNPSSYIQANGVADPKIQSFDGHYRMPRVPKNALSASIWIDACVMNTLAKVMALPNANLDGANINLAAYDQKDLTHRPSQKYDKQSTILIVPTNLGEGGSHENNWDITDCLIKQYADKKKDFAPGGFNHGELCPQICN